MTDKKKTIIDGVDVSGCEYYDQGICNIPDVIETYDSCIDKGACYFKQLQRKKAELLKLQNTISSELPAYEKCISMARDDVYAGILDRNASDTDFCIHVIRETRNQLQRKTAECENNRIAYKNELEIYDNECLNLKQELDEKTAEYDELHTKYIEVLNLSKQNADANEYCLQELEKENQKLKQALDEIERIITKMDADECAYGDFDCENCNSDGKCDTAAKRTVLDIIRKAKGEE